MLCLTLIYELLRYLTTNYCMLENRHNYLMHKFTIEYILF